MSASRPHKDGLVERNIISIMVRWIALVFILWVCLVVRLLTGWPTELAPTLLIVAAIAVENTVYCLHWWRVRTRGRMRYSKVFTEWQSLPDLVLLAVLTYFTGGVDSPFLYLPVLSLLMSGNLISNARIVAALTAISMVLTGVAVGLEESSFPPPLPLGFAPWAPEFSHQGHVWLAMAVYYGFLLVAVGGSISSNRTIRRRTQALRESEEHYRDLVENIGDLVFAIDNEGILTFVNRTVEARTGYTAAEILGRSLFDLIDPESIPALKEASDRGFGLGLPVRGLQVSLRAKDGRRFQLEVNMSRIRRNHQVVGARGVARDITERKQLEAELQQRLSDLARLYEASSQIGASLSLEETLQTVVRGAAEATQATAAAVILVDMEGRPELLVGVGRMAGIDPAHAIRPAGVSAQVLASGKPAIFPSLLEAAAVVNPAMLEGGDGAAICLPLKGGDGPIGVMWVSYATPRQFDRSEVQLLETFADQIAIAISNARLYTREQRRAQLLEAASSVSREAAALLDLDTLLQRVVQLLNERLGYPLATILLVDERAGELESRAFASSYPQAVPLGYRQRIEMGIAGQAARQGQTILVRDVATDPRYLAFFPQTRSELDVPLKHRDKVIGVLNLESDRVQAFPEEDVAVLELLADQIATAINNAQLLTERQRAVEELAALNQIAQTISSALELDQVLTVIREQVGRLIDNENFFLALYDAVEDTVSFPMAYEDGRAVHWPPRRGGNGLTEYVIRSRQPLLIRGDLHAALVARGITMIVDGWEPEGWLGVPLLLQDRVVGVMAVQSRQPDRFDESHQRILMAVGSQAAIAIEKARLLEQARQAAAQLSALYQVGKRTSSLVSDPQGLLAWIADEARRLVHADAAGFRLLDGDRLILGGRTPGADEIMTDEPIPVGQSISGRIVAENAPLMSADLSTDPRLSAARRQEALTTGYRGFLGIPLRLREQAIGVLNVYSKRSRQWSQADMDLLFAFADQAVIAIQNTRLYQALTDQARRDSLTQVYNHGYFLESLQNLITEQAVPLSLIMLDVDHFKEYNDRYGHVSGDLVLKAIVQAIRQNIHKEDVVGRWGGEEFGVLLARTDAAGAQVVAERIRQTLATTPLVDASGQTVLKPTVSQGIATYPSTASSGDDLVNKADAALYRAKAGGRDQVYVAPAAEGG